MVKLFYTTYNSVDLAHHEIYRAKGGKGGINSADAENASLCGLFCHRLPSQLPKLRGISAEIVSLSLKELLRKRDYQCIVFTHFSYPNDISCHRQKTITAMS